MRLISLLVALAVTLLGSAYWYKQFDTTCNIPLTYRVGDIDPRFDITSEDVLAFALQAESVWEDTVEEELFVYDPEGNIPIHFVFDNRQALSDEEEIWRQDLEAKEGMSEDVAAQYDALVAEFRPLQKEYNAKTSAYKDALASYNAEVKSWNDKGGAPADVVEKLDEEKEILDEQYEAIQMLTTTLNKLTEELNRIGARGNQLIERYNEAAAEYNTRFGEPHTFTQGDYTQRDINIYQFDSEEELVLVLAHEFGHALALDHVENPHSIMYNTMKEQSVAKGVSEEDLLELKKVCAPPTGVMGFVHTISTIF